MGRAVWKLPYLSREFIQRIAWLRTLPVNPMYSDQIELPPCKSWSRSTVVTKRLIKQPVKLHDGRELISIKLDKIHIGIKLGALVLTKTIGSFVHKHNRLILKKKKAAAILKQRKVKKKKSAKGGVMKKKK